MRLSRWVVTALCVALFGVAVAFSRVAWAEPAGLSAYEATNLKQAAARVGASGVVVRAPEGKFIERVDVVILDVFDEQDPVPDVVNVFHATTREFVIRQELLFEAGQRYSSARADESARNLRTIRQLSLVLVVPVEGTTPDRVRVLVITKDVWSLRLNWDIEGTAGKNGPTITRFVLAPTEENFLGTHTTVGAVFTLDPGIYSFGLSAGKRRLFGSDIELNAIGGVIYGRASGEPEGSYGTFTYGAPIRTTSDRWGWGVGFTFLDDIARRFDETGKVQRFDAEVTPQDDALPIEYARERFQGGVEVVRSFGVTDKYDFALGAEADRRLSRYRHRPGADPAAEQELIDEWLPVNDTRISPFAQLRTRREHYFHTFDLETLALQEDYRLGPEVLLRVYPASSAAGSTRDLVGLTSGLAYTASFGDGMARAVAQNNVEYEFHGDHQASFSADLHVATPRFGFARFVADGLVADAYENYLNVHYALGGDGRLRGYPLSGFEGSLRGTSIAAGNAELRTTSVDIFSMHVGLAAFYDAGAAADALDELSFVQSVGLGLRILFPYFDRTVFRADWAFPLAQGYSTLPGALFVTFGQAFGMPELATPTVMKLDVQ